MMPTASAVRLGLLRRVLVHLDDRSFNNLARAHLKLTQGDGQLVPIVAQLQLALADWIAHLGKYLNEQQMVTLVMHYGPRIQAYGSRAAHALGLGQEPPGLMLTISDGRWVHTNHCLAWFDLEAERDVPELPAPCVTHILCDVAALYQRLCDRLDRVQGGGRGNSDPGFGRSVEQTRGGPGAGPRPVA